MKTVKNHKQEMENHPKKLQLKITLVFKKKLGFLSKVLNILNLLNFEQNYICIYKVSACVPASVS